MISKSWRIAALPLILMACGGPKLPPPVPPTTIAVTITTSEMANDGAPVMIRVYQLASSGSFEAAAFFPLFEKDATALQADLVKRDDFLMAPGTSKTLELGPDDRVHAIGVFAAYRDPDTVTWHGTVDVPTHQASILRITASKVGVMAQIAPDKIDPVKAGK